MINKYTIAVTDEYGHTFLPIFTDEFTYCEGCEAEGKDWCGDLTDVFKVTGCTNFALRFGEENVIWKKV